MGNYAQSIANAVQAAGVITEAVGVARSAKAQESAAKFNRRANDIQTSEAIERSLAMNRRERARNITRVAKSGVRLSGSPLAVIEMNDRIAEQERSRIQRAGDMRRELLTGRARSARDAGRIGIASSVISGAGRLGARAVRNA